MIKILQCIFINFTFPSNKLKINLKKNLKNRFIPGDRKGCVCVCVCVCGRYTLSQNG